MPKTWQGWIKFAIAVGVVVFVINNVAFLGNLVGRK